MPNTPATIGEGITVWSCTPNLTVEEREDVKRVLCTFGKAVRQMTGKSSSSLFLPSKMKRLFSDSYPCHSFSLFVDETDLRR